MTPEDFLDHLLGLPSPQKQSEWLQTQSDTLTVEYFEAFKIRSDSLALEYPQCALDITEAALLAASFAKHTLPQIKAIIHWARGNAWLCMGEYQKAFSDYEQACKHYESQNDTVHRLDIARLQTNMIEALKNLGHYDDALLLAETARQTLQPWSDSRYMATLEMNVGSLNRMLGYYNVALEAYERGRSIFLTLDNQLQVARIDINRARVLGILDRFTEAESLLQNSREKLTALEKPLPAARATLNLATLFSQRGQHRQALKFYHKAVADFAALEDQTDVAVANLYMTYDYLALNLIPEALETAVQARDRLKKLSMPRYVALATGNWAIAARKQGHYAEALSALSQARTFFVEHNAPVEVAKLDLERVICLREMDNLAEAQTIATKVAHFFNHSPLPLQAAQANLALADVLLTSKYIEQSAKLYTQALENLFDFPTLSWQAYAGLGRAAEEQGQIKEAYKYYQQAIKCLESVEESLGLTELQAGFLADKLDVYRRAIAIALNLQAHDAAFTLSQKAKTGVWRKFLSTSGTCNAQQAIEQNQENTKLSDLRQQWHWIYRRLAHLNIDDEDTSEAPLDSQRGDTEAKAQWAMLKNTEQQIAAIWRTRHSSTATLPTPSFSKVQQRLPENTILLDYVCLQEYISVFVMTQHHVHIIPNIAPTRTVTHLLNRWRFNLESVHLALLKHQSSLGVGLAEEAHDILNSLYQHLITPISDYWNSPSTLWIIPDSELWEIPFAALYDGEKYLIERFTLLQVPGLLLQKTSRSRSKTISGTNPLIVGYSDGGRLNYALHEAQTVAKVWDTSTILIEDMATVSQLREAARECTLLHLATHGIFRQDAPLFSVLHLSDGGITAGDLETWHMPQVELVTLSACETGINLNWGSDLLGLARGFWHAGAQRMLVSLWAVDDASTADLMVHFYNALREGQSAENALQAAQTNALVKYRHPFYWSGFTLLELAI